MHGFVNQGKSCVKSTLLRHLTCLVSVCAFINIFSSCSLFLLFLRGEKTGVHRDKGIAVAPPQRQKAKTPVILIFAVVIASSQKFDMLGVGAMIGRVVDDENLFSIFAR